LAVSEGASEAANKAKAAKERVKSFMSRTRKMKYLRKDKQELGEKHNFWQASEKQAPCRVAKGYSQGAVI